MTEWANLAAVIAIVAHELALFAAVGFLIGGLDDVAVDLIWAGRAVWRRRMRAGRQPAGIATLPPPERPGWLAVFIPAWDEAAVIAPMLRHALTSFDHPDYRLYVGCYLNDPATIAAVRAVDDPRVRLVVTPWPGPTTKADCLNALWFALHEDERERGTRAKCVVLHDAEDIVHSGELKLFDRLIEKFDLVQIPVMPLVDRSSRWISGHYCDEFAEHHGKLLLVREAIGAGLPLAGVGCAIARDALDTMAADHGGAPFDPTSLTEDYEIGLKLSETGGRAAFVSIAAGGETGLVAVRAFFPGTIKAAVRQKARWMAGIALAGWDRLGWRRGMAENWMRGRDRRVLLGAIVLLAAYVSLVFWVCLFVIWSVTGYSYRQPSDCSARSCGSIWGC